MKATDMTYVELVAVIAAAKARGASVLCGKNCGRSATLLLACASGEVQGLACAECWRGHLDTIEAAKVFETSGLAEPWCSRCGIDAPPAGHIVTEQI